MKVFSFILFALICCLFLSAGIHLTQTHKEKSVQIAKEREIAQTIFKMREAKRIREEKAYKARVNKIVRDIRRINKKIDQKHAVEIAEAFIKYGKEYRVRINKLLQIASLESGFKPHAINRETGDYGLMQINWNAWGRRLVRRPKQLLDIDTNIKYACYILSYNRRIGFDRIGHYHSFTPEFVEIYESKLEPFANKFAWSY